MRLATAWCMWLAAALRPCPAQREEAGRTQRPARLETSAEPSPTSGGPSTKKGPPLQSHCHGSWGFLEWNQDGQRPYFSNVIFVNASAPPALSLAK